MTTIRTLALATSLAWVAMAHAEQPPVRVPAAAPAVVDETRWTRCVEALGRVLDGRLPRTALAGVAWSHASVVPFERNRTEAAIVLPDRLPIGMTLISSRAYTIPVVSCATDLIADIQASHTLPDTILRRFIPPEAADAGESRAAVIRRADQTMARWLSTMLNAEQPGTPVGVVVLYDDGTRASTHPTLWFVIVRGQTDAAGNVGVAEAIYGTMESALR